MFVLRPYLLIVKQAFKEIPIKSCHVFSKEKISQETYHKVMPWFESVHVCRLCSSVSFLIARGIKFY